MESNRRRSVLLSRYVVKLELGTGSRVVVVV
jgi:hypothetical protein